MGSKRRRALKAARLAAELARSAAEIERADEALAKALLERRAAAQAAAIEGRSLPPEPRRRGLLVINTKSGPNDDSILQTRPLVELLAQHGIDVDVRVKLSKRQARKDARAFAKDGCELVIAAGGDGTIQAVARGLIGTDAVLGIVPLGTYNNVAASLGVPTDMAEAVALIAAGPSRMVDVGEVRVEGPLRDSKRRRKPRPFFEIVSIGIAAALAPAGQEAKDGNWLAAAEALPAATQMQPAAAALTLDREEPPLQAETLLVTVSNTPRAAAGLTMAPEARVDDGLLDVAVYRGMVQGALALHFAAKATVGEPSDERIQRARARRIEVRTDPPLPVAADSKVIGTTPALIKVLPGALRVICGHGAGLSLPVSEALVAAATAEARRAAAEPPAADGPGMGERAVAVAGAVASAAVTAVAEPVVAFVERKMMGGEAGARPDPPHP